MATVRGALTLYDGMTQPLHSIHKALNIVLSSFEAMQNASGNAVDVSAIRDAREELARSEALLNGVENNIRNAERRQDRFNDRIREGSNAVDGMAAKFDRLKGVIATLGIGAGIQKLVELSDRITSTTARLNLIADDGGTIGNLEQQLENLTQTVTLTVDVDDGGTVDSLTSQFQALNETASNLESVFTVDAMDNGTISNLEQQINSLPNEKSLFFNATDNGSVSDVEQQIQQVQDEQSVFVEATDRGAVAALEEKIGQLPDEKSLLFTATDNGSVSDMEQQIQQVKDEQSVFFNATDNGTIGKIKHQIRDMDQKATIAVETVGEDRIVELDQQANDLNQQTLVTVSVNDNGSVAALDAQINGLNRETNVVVDVTANVTDHNSVKILEQKIMASAQRSRSAYLDTANAIASMGANARSAFATNDELIAFMEQINKQFVIGGASAQGQAAAMLQLTQAMGAGVLRGEELNSILENAPGIARAIEQYMNVAEGSIKEYAEEGLITADVVKNAMFAAADETNAKFESMPMTWAQIWTSVQNLAIQALDPILTKINDVANSDRIQGFVDGMMNAFGAAASLLETLFNLVSSVGSAIYDNWSWISPLIYGIAGALTVYCGAMLVYNAIQAISTALAKAHAFAEQVKAAHTMLATGSTLAQTAAQHGLNAALLACPIMWVVLLVIALISVFYAAVAAVNRFAGTSISATGIICGVFMFAVAFIGNLLVSLRNLFSDIFVFIYNLVASVANFIGNVFDDPVAAICRLFFDMADNIFSILQSLASAIDTIFGSNFAGAVQGWRDNLGGWVDKTFGKGKEIMAKMNAEDLHLERFEYGKAFNTGYHFGEGIENKISDAFDFSSKDPGNSLSNSLAQQPVAVPYSPSTPFDTDPLDKIKANTGDTAANTAAASDALEFAEEDLQYLRDIAEREAINRYTTAEVKVEQHNENHIEKDTDLDGIMDAFAYDFAEKLDISAEGVHK